MPGCFDISRYLTDVYFDIVWGCHIFLGTPKYTPQKSIFSTAKAWVPVLYDISRHLTDKYFDIVWGCHPPGDPPNGPPKKSIFLMAQLLVPVCFDISRYLTNKYFDIVWGCHPLPPGTPQMYPPKINFLNGFNLGCQCFMISGDIYRQIFWLYFSGGSIIRYFWIIADFTVDKKYFWASQH